MWVRPLTMICLRRFKDVNIRTEPHSPRKTLLTSWSLFSWLDNIPHQALLLGRCYTSLIGRISSTFLFTGWATEAHARHAVRHCMRNKSICLAILMELSVVWHMRIQRACPSWTHVSARHFAWSVYLCHGAGGANHFTACSNTVK